MKMKYKNSQRGSLVLPLAITATLLVAVVLFGGWAFVNMLDYKNNVDQHVAQAVATAKQQEDAAKDASFALAEKQPLRTYSGPSAYGSVQINYPKTWSAYVADTRQGSPYVDGYFYPNVVPDTQDQASVFALRVQVVQSPYSSELNQASSAVQNGSAKVSPYKAPKVPTIIGARIDGKLPNGKSGTMVLLPLRNMTLKLWTEAPQFQADFDSNILPNFSFAP